MTGCFRMSTVVLIGIPIDTAMHEQCVCFAGDSQHFCATTTPQPSKPRQKRRKAEALCVFEKQNSRPLAPWLASAKHTSEQASDPICSLIHNRRFCIIPTGLVPVNHPHIGPLLVLQRLCNQAAKVSIMIPKISLQADCLLILFSWLLWVSTSYSIF